MSDSVDALNLSGYITKKSKRQSVEIKKRDMKILQLEMKLAELEQKNNQCKNKRLALLEQLSEREKPLTKVETNHEYFEFYIKSYFMKLLQHLSDQYSGALPTDSERMNGDLLEIYDRVSGSVSPALPVNPLNWAGAFFKVISMVDYDLERKSYKHAETLKALLPKIDLLVNLIAENLLKHLTLVIDSFNRGQVKALADACIEILLRLMKSPSWMKEFTSIEQSLDYQQLANKLTFEIIFSRLQSFSKFPAGEKLFPDNALWQGGFIVIDDDQCNYYQLKNTKENRSNTFPPVILPKEKLPLDVRGNFTGWYHKVYLPSQHDMSLSRKVKRGFKYIYNGIGSLVSDNGFFTHSQVNHRAYAKYLKRLEREFGLTASEVNAKWQGMLPDADSPQVTPDRESLSMSRG